jgi:hypothetical protein
MDNRCRRALVFLSLFASACGSGSAMSPADGSTDRPMERTDGRTDQGARNPDTGGGAASTCTTLVWQFGGCTTPMLDECGREYATFPAVMQGDLDTYAACLRTMAFGLPDAAVSAGVDAGCPTTSDSLNRWYLHGGCEGEAAQVSHDIGIFDPCTGTAVSCTTLTSESDCSSKYGECTWTAGACADLTSITPCAQAAGACATVPGCMGTGFPACGGAGQPECFFSQALPGNPGL